VAENTRVENEPEVPGQPSPDVVAREPWPEEMEPAASGVRRRSYFKRHPGARWLLIAAVLLLLAVFGFYLWNYYSLRESTDDAQIDGHIVPVSARVAGTVISVQVDDNQVVEKDAILVQLDPKDYQVALDRARADLASAEAAAVAAQTGVPIMHTSTTSTVSTAEAALETARKQVNAAEARHREAEASYTNAAADLKRAEQLVAKDEISQQRYDAAVTAAAVAKASVEGAIATVASAQSQVAEAEAGVRASSTGPQQVAVFKSRAAEAEAAVQKYRSAVQQAELNLQYATVRAPFAGVVSKRSVEPGQVVGAGQPLYALINLSEIYVTANFKETQLEHMCPGQPATIHVDSFDHDYKGHVDSLSGATGARFSLLPPENATGNYVKVVQRVPVKLVFEPDQDPDHKFRPGMSVEPTVMVTQPCGK
jgi:membrane fusion protein (multidrug efflux system)